MNNGTKKLSFVEKAGYSLGDGAANFVFMTMILYQLRFYTDTMHIVAGIAGTLLFVGRFWDAFFDPMVGVMADRTNTRWGKFRPWVLWTAVPWAIVMVLAYTVPGFSYGPTLIYAIVTNILLMSLYSANNTPYSAMTAVMTGDVNERTSLSQYRFVAAMIAQLIVGGFTLPLVAKFGGDSKSPKGWQMTIGLWALICIVCFVIAFLTTRERIKPVSHEKVSIRQSFGTLYKIVPWVAMFIVSLAHFTANSIRDGTMTYFFQYYVNKDRLFEFVRGAGLPWAKEGVGSGWWHWLLDAFGLVIKADKSNVADVGFSLFNMSGQFVLVIGVLFSTYLSIKFGKKAVALVGFGFTTVFMAAFIFLPADSIWATFILLWLRSLVYAPTIPLIWAMFADVVDYAEWKFGFRATGVIYATVLFALKVGLSLGILLAGWLLSGFGYVAPKDEHDVVVQTTQALTGIRLTISIFPAILYCIIVGALIFYPIGKKLNLQIQDELAERRKLAESKAAPEAAL